MCEKGEMDKLGASNFKEQIMNKNIRFLWLVLATVLGFFVGGKWNIPLAAWIAPVFLVRFFRDSDKAGRNFLLMWLASTGVVIVSWGGATALSLTSPLAELILFLLTALISLLPYVVDRIYYRRFTGSFWLTLVFPAAFAAVDFFSASSPFGTFGASAYSQSGFTSAMQVVSVTGLWGIPFMIGWFASLINYMWENGFKVTRLVMTSIGLLVLILGLGFSRTLLKSQPEQTVVVAGFSLPAGKSQEVIAHLQAEDEAGFRQIVDELHAEQLNQISAMAQQGANIVSLQEGAGIGMTDQVEKLISGASMIAQEEDIYVVLPTFDLEKSPPENIVHIIDPHGDVVLSHVKYGGSMFEGSLPGNGILQTVDTPYGKLSAVICWDADFPDVIQQVGRQDVDLLFVPSNDWLGVKDIHHDMAAFRAVENGVSIFRQTGQGISSARDVYGQEISHVDMFTEAVTGFTGIQMVEMPVGSINTLYTSLGDIFGSIMMVGFAGLLIGSFFARKKFSKSYDFVGSPTRP
jgi:apolipoprotein N-acyltransferase